MYKNGKLHDTFADFVWPFSQKGAVRQSVVGLHDVKNNKLLGTGIYF